MEVLTTMRCDRFKKQRLKKGINQVELAKIFNVSKQTVSNWERGERVPDADTITKLANYFGVTTDYLLDNDVLEQEKVIEKTDNSVTDIHFENAQDAMAFILKQPSIMAFGVPDLTDEEIIEFANDILKHIELVSYKYKK